MGAWADRHGVWVAAVLGGASMGLGYVIAASAGSMAVFGVHARHSPRPLRLLGRVRSR